MLARQIKRGGVKEALNGRFIVISGDALTDLDITDAIEAHEKSGAMATIILKRVVTPIEYGIVLTALEEIKDADCVIVAVAHNQFRAMTLEQIKGLFAEKPDDEKVLIDVKGLYSVKDLEVSGMRYWRL